jgi:hypothetical protein
MVAVCQFCDHEVEVTEDTKYVCCRLCGHTWWKAYQVTADEMFLVKEVRN